MVNEFNKGVWVAVEHLILGHDQPSIAKEIIQQCGISLEQAVELAKHTDYEPHKIIDTLLTEQTWKLPKNTKVSEK